MKKLTAKRSALALALLAGAGALAWTLLPAATADSKAAADSKNARPTLTVSTVKAQYADWPVQLAANGNIAAWQESIVGSELGGLRLAEVLVNVGDKVRRGQVLARFASDTVAADVARQEGSVEQARAALSEAELGAEGARQLASSGVLSAQQTKQYLSAEQSARGRLKTAQASLRLDQIRLRQTELTAPDDGVISARNATLGAVTGPGAELFRLIRQGRLEWRASLPSSALAGIAPGQAVKVVAANGAEIDGKVRMIGPTVDPVSRYALVYVDLPASTAHAGMFATGKFELGHGQALTVPQSALLTRDGRYFVFQVGPKAQVIQTQVTLGRRIGSRVEVLTGATPAMQLVAQGAGFLSDGDMVKVAAAPAAGVALVSAK